MTSLPIPALQRSSRLADRQPGTVRRRSARVLSRIAVLLAFDLAAYFAARAVAQPLAGAGIFPAWSGRATELGPLASPGAPASLIFPMALFAGLLLTASYARHRSPIVGVRIFAAAVIASAVTALALASVLGVRDALTYSGLFGLVCAVALGAGRWVSHTFAVKVWPRGRGALPAVRIATGAARDSENRASWGDYVVVEEIYLRADQPARDVPAAIERLQQVAMGGGEAIIATADVSDEVLTLLTHAALDLSYRVIFPARAIEIEGVRPRLVWHDGKPFLEISTPALRASAVFTKRVFDVIGSTALLLLASPLMAVIAVMIRLDSRGPVLFAQDRAGFGGRTFRMLKFRTMRDGADDQKQELSHLNRSGDVRLFKIPEDPRVTRVGRYLRLWSLDELPQLINVLAGEMSLVGPRPFFESDFAAYEDRHFRRLDTKPGITGLWQVSGRSEVVDFEDVIFLDRQYIEQWSLWLDLSILVRTIPAVLRREGAY